MTSEAELHHAMRQTKEAVDALAGDVAQTADRYFTHEGTQRAEALRDRLTGLLSQWRRANEAYEVAREEWEVTSQRTQTELAVPTGEHAVPDEGEGEAGDHTQPGIRRG